MMPRVMSAVARFLVLCSVLTLAVGIAASPLAAQAVTGKVEGSVTDQAGAPVANAQVFVVGTSFGAVTNDKGYYFINNVPVGTYNVRAQLIDVREDAIVGGRADGHHRHGRGATNRAARPGHVEIHHLRSGDREAAGQ